MNGIWYYVIGFVVIWTFAYIFKTKNEEHGIEVSFPLLMWRTERFKNFIDKIAKKSPKFWKWYMNIGIVIAYISMIVMTVLLIQSLTTITKTPSVSIIIPGVEVPGSPIYIPFISGLIALALLIIVHEFSHGILSRVENIDVKSIGLLLFAILPGAFVEPDEDQMLKASKMSRLRIYAAGSMANIVLAIVALIIFLLISNFVVPMVFDQNGVTVSEVVKDAPSQGFLEKGMVITQIDNYSVSNATNYAYAVSTLHPNHKTTVKTDKGSYTFMLGTNPNNKTAGYMGIKGEQHLIVKNNIMHTYGNQLPWLWFSLEDLFKWIYFLNLSVGLFNLLPMKPLDGGRMFEILLSYKFSDMTTKAVTDFSSYFILIVIVVSLAVGIGGSFF